jgi:cardiolipin synthase
MRSFELNFEIAALIYDEGFAARLLKVFENDLARSSLVNPAEWDKRKRSAKIKESLSRILGPLY